jgi:hypothetical protein
MYYQLECDEDTMTAYVTPENESSESLVRGRLIDAEEEILPFRYSYRDPTGAPLFDYYSGDCLMSKRLVEALEKAGADNLQKFEVELVDEQTGKVNTDFWNVNIIGLVACAKLDESQTSELGSSYYFHDLVIDPKKIGEMRIFRLAESLIDVLVDDHVAEQIQAGGFRGIVLNAVKAAPST